MKAKITNKIWKETIATLIIVSTILVTHGQFNTVKTIPVSKTEAVMLDSGELPSSEPLYLEETKPVISIDQLVADVESGKAGNGEERVIYLGEYYEEVQAIINQKYKDKPKTVNSDYTRTTSGSKGEYQNYAYDLVITMGWSEADFQALVNLWERESGWNPNSHNKSSGAHGIPQSLPASKMSSHGEDYYTNGYTQIKWGLDYIKNRYGSPIAAWNHFKNKNWY